MYKLIFGHERLVFILSVLAEKIIKTRPKSSFSKVSYVIWRVKQLIKIVDEKTNCYGFGKKIKRNNEKIKEKKSGREKTL